MSEPLVPKPDRRTGQPMKVSCTKDCEVILIIDRRLNDHAEQLLAGKARMDTLEHLIAKNNSDTATVLEIVSLGKGFFKVLGWLGTAAKTLAAIGTPIAAFLYWLKTGSK